MKSFLTKEEMRFINQHEISLDEIFDGRKINTASSKQICSQLRIPFFKGNPCREFGHRLRTSAGHCIQCNTARISFVKRENISQYLYFAYSVGTDIFKIGVTSNIIRRERTLTSQMYASLGEWLILSYALVNNSGNIERIIHGKFSKFSVSASYVRSGIEQDARELFDHPIKWALAKFNREVKKLGFEIVKHRKLDT